MYDYDGFIAAFDSDLDNAAYYSHNIELFHVAAKYEYDLGNDHDAIREMLGAIFHTWNFTNELVEWVTKVSGLWRLKALAGGIRDDFLALGNGEEYELTLHKMLSAYVDANDEQRSFHRILLDAYKSSMYGKPFDLTTHTLWVRMFQSWE